MSWPNGSNTVRWCWQVYSCWGTFKAFKKGKKEDVCFAGGVKCEGHFLFIKPGCDAKIVVRCVLSAAQEDVTTTP